MYGEKIAALLALNGIDDGVFREKLYRTLLLGVFETICKEMNRQNARTAEKERFRMRRDKIAATKSIVDRYAGCRLDEEDYAELAQLLTAHFRTGDGRKHFDGSFRSRIMDAQRGRCALCGAGIGADEARLDHVVPWDYVGDHLDGNYQMLCRTCNSRKGRATAFELAMMLVRRR